jgi:flagellar basal-body rod modification protein FlgD
MDTPALTAGTQAQQSQGQAAGLNGGGKLAEDFDTFLGILVTQLNNQDPLEPMKSQEFTNQLVQFSTVEQAIATNEKLDQMLQAQAGNRATQAVNFIGKDIAVDGNRVTLEGGSAGFGYTLHDEAQTVALEITDATGTVVRTLSGETAAGRHNVVWDGKTDSGQPASEGIYNVQVYAVDADNKTVGAETETRGRVTGFEVRDEQIHLQVGAVDVPFDKVTAVYDTPNAVGPAS